MPLTSRSPKRIVHRMAGATVSTLESEPNEFLKENAISAVESPGDRNAVWESTFRPPSVMSGREIADRLEPFTKPIDMPNDPE